MDNYTCVMAPGHSLQTQICFNFFSHRTKISKCQQTLHTFISLTMSTHKPKLAKECNFAKVLLKFEIDSFYA